MPLSLDWAPAKIGGLRSSLRRMLSKAHTEHEQTSHAGVVD